MLVKKTHNLIVHEILWFLLKLRGFLRPGRDKWGGAPSWEERKDKCLKYSWITTELEVSDDCEYWFPLATKIH